ncbi:radical SAM protein [Clostridium sp. MSJ-4]|uniref:Radical SAM protein n=1 Tax=Clostridium simiarum TaxID=2841506 RepID=A0ABS6F4J8_9CLOT|nr:radical SAM protein [Clostridium simiarum]MBU5593193.1 radical SAM protein [Clostridium simiarum]
MINSIDDIYNISKENNDLTRATIELLTKCNWRCRHCYIPEHNNSGLEIEIIFELFYKLRDMGCFELVFTGGEPFFRKDILDILRKARDMHFSVIIFTNISLLNEEIIKQLSSLNISLISCSIFSLDNNIHDYITGVNGSLLSTLMNANLLKKYNIPLQIKTSLMKDNYKSYRDLKCYCDKNGFFYKADPVIFNKINGNSEPLNFRMSTEQLSSVLKDVDTLSGVETRKHNNQNLICSDTKHSIYIDSKGDIYPCNRLLIKTGSVYNNDLSDIWNNSPILKIFQEMTWSSSPDCVDCEYESSCVRCPGNALFENGSIFSKSNISCDIAKERFNYHKEIYSNEEIY